jgi:activator of HSP90 ATPase
MSVEFEVSDSFPVPPQVVYDTWLDSAGHAAMTGYAASTSAEVGVQFMAGDGYINGKNLVLTPGQLIRQSWRTQEFDDSDPDSELEITLEPEGAGTQLTLKHTNLPDHGMQYKQGWIDHYFGPMKTHFQK